MVTTEYLVQTYVKDTNVGGPGLGGVDTNKCLRLSERAFIVLAAQMFSLPDRLPMR
jgi:hypothetical protein